MVRQAGYKQVSLTAEAHRALQQMTYVMAAEIAEKVTLSQAVLIAHRMLSINSGQVATLAQELGVEPNEHRSPDYGAPRIAGDR